MRLNNFIITTSQFKNHSIDYPTPSISNDIDKTESIGSVETSSDAVGFATLRSGEGNSDESRTSQGGYNIYKITEVSSVSQALTFDGKLSARPEDSNSSMENLVVADILMMVGTR